MSETENWAVKSKIASIGVAIEQYRDKYLGQDPLLLICKADYDEFVQYAAEITGTKPPKSLQACFGAPVKVSIDIESGSFALAKVVHYV
jgi:hypothetical protein